jgi:hypothetical protein
MAVRFTAGSQNYSATTGIPAGNVYTFTAWIYATVDSAAGQTVYWVTNNSDVFTGINIRDNPHNLQGVDGTLYGSGGIGAVSASLGIWWRVALVVNGANVTFYRAPYGLALGWVSVADATPPATPVTLFLGDNRYDEFFDGRMAAVKMWQAALTPQEVAQELEQYAPVRRANLLRFHPFLVAETRDHSGNGFTLSGGSGATTEPGPPIPWIAPHRRVVARLAAAGGGTFWKLTGQPFGLAGGRGLAA